MIGPQPSEGVWLKHGWARTAHRLSQRPFERWDTTPCGLKTGSTDHSSLLGLAVRWDNLDQQAVALCKVCWKGYEPVDSRTINELKWWNQQHALVAEIFSEAYVVISTPTHLDQFQVEGPGGNVVWSSSVLNYDTLKRMLRIMLQEETHRKISRGRMSKLMDELRRWEQSHPYGEPISEEDDRPVLISIAEIEPPTSMA